MGYVVVIKRCVLMASNMESAHNRSLTLFIDLFEEWRILSVMYIGIYECKYFIPIDICVRIDCYLLEFKFFA